MAAVVPAKAAGIRQAIILNALINLKFIIAFRTWLGYHKLIREFPRLQLQGASLSCAQTASTDADFEEDMLQQLRYILRRTAQHRLIASYNDGTLNQIRVLHHDFHQFLIG
ncbi:hypothetical protein SAMN05216412_107109 [Nitrosospira multiformis]|uniref:Uncharacterized protein n=1 Tax=Nitrosospira multiformis TaxID=1231 RepID=A0A1I0EVV4_9PROT|nr:hypothetical protein SAMN05216412_107109 [Nitrosospira multiformis]